MMQKIQPEMKEIQKKYKKDPEGPARPSRSFGRSTITIRSAVACCC